MVIVTARSQGVVPGRWGAGVQPSPAQGGRQWRTVDSWGLLQGSENRKPKCPPGNQSPRIHGKPCSEGPGIEALVPATPRLSVTQHARWGSWPRRPLAVKNPPANVGDIRDIRSSPGAGKMPWRRAWQPTPRFLPGESHGQRSLMGCSPQGRRV